MPRKGAGSRIVRQPCRVCGEDVAAHHIGYDPWKGDERYIGTDLPRAMEYKDQDEGGLRRFGVPDRVRIQHKRRRGFKGNYTSPEGLEIHDENVIREAMGATRHHPSFRGVAAYAPFLLWCPNCGASQRIDPPPDVTYVSPEDAVAWERNYRARASSERSSMD